MGQVTAASSGLSGQAAQSRGRLASRRAHERRPFWDSPLLGVGERALEPHGQTGAGDAGGAADNEAADESERWTVGAVETCCWCVRRRGRGSSGDGTEAYKGRKVQDTRPESGASTPKCILLVQPALLRELMEIGEIIHGRHSGAKQVLFKVIKKFAGQIPNVRCEMDTQGRRRLKLINSQRWSAPRTFAPVVPCSACSAA